MLSAAPMWNSGVQATKVRSGKKLPSARAMALRAIIARWLMTAAFGSPVVPLV